MPQVKQLRWKTSPSARTNCPVIGCPHFAHVCPDAEPDDVLDDGPAIGPPFTPAVRTPSTGELEAVALARAAGDAGLLDPACVGRPCPTETVEGPATGPAVCGIEA